MTPENDSWPKDTWTVAGRTFRSRLIVGTGKYKDFAQNAAALIEAQAQEIAELRAAVRDADAEFLRIYRSTPREWHERHATAIRRAQEPTDGR